MTLNKDHHIYDHFISFHIIIQNKKSAKWAYCPTPGVNGPPTWGKKPTRGPFAPHFNLLLLVDKNFKITSITSEITLLEINNSQITSYHHLYGHVKNFNHYQIHSSDTQNMGMSQCNPHEPISCIWVIPARCRTSTSFANYAIAVKTLTLRQVFIILHWNNSISS